MGGGWERKAVTSGGMRLRREATLPGHDPLSARPRWIPSRMRRRHTAARCHLSQDVSWRRFPSGPGVSCLPPSRGKIPGRGHGPRCGGSARAHGRSSRRSAPGPHQDPRRELPPSGQSHEFLLVITGDEGRPDRIHRDALAPESLRDRERLPSSGPDVREDGAERTPPRLRAHEPIRNRWPERASSSRPRGCRGWREALARASSSLRYGGRPTSSRRRPSEESGRRGGSRRLSEGLGRR